MRLTFGAYIAFYCRLLSFIVATCHDLSICRNLPQSDAGLIIVMPERVVAEGVPKPLPLLFGQLTRKGRDGVF